MIYFIYVSHGDRLILGHLWFQVRWIILLLELSEEYHICLSCFPNGGAVKKYVTCVEYKIEELSCLGRALWFFSVWLTSPPPSLQYVAFCGMPPLRCPALK